MKELVCMELMTKDFSEDLIIDWIKYIFFSVA